MEPSPLDTLLYYLNILRFVCALIVAELHHCDPYECWRHVPNMSPSPSRRTLEF